MTMDGATRPPIVTPRVGGSLSAGTVRFVSNVDASQAANQIDSAEVPRRNPLDILPLWVYLPLALAMGLVPTLAQILGATEAVWIIVTSIVATLLAVVAFIGGIRAMVRLGEYYQPESLLVSYGLLAIVMLSTAVGLMIADWGRHWPLLPSALLSLIVSIWATGNYVVWWQRNDSVKRQLERRNRIRRHPARWTSLAIVEAIVAIILGLYAALPSTALLGRLAAATIGLALGFLFIRFLATASKARRPWDLDLQRSGQPVIEKIKAELQTSQQSLSSTATEIGRAVEQVDELFARTAELERQAREAVALASLNSDQADAIVAGLRRTSAPAVVLSLVTFVLGLLVSWIFSNWQWVSGRVEELIAYLTQSG